MPIRLLDIGANFVTGHLVLRITTSHTRSHKGGNTCTYTNADCLTNKVSELRLLIRNHKPTIVGITEVKPKNFRYDIEDAEIALDGYDMFGCNLHNKTGRGCAVYVKKQCTG